MPRLLRIWLVVVGLAPALYGIASLTGGWLGTPPWWEVEEVPDSSIPMSFSEAESWKPPTRPVASSQLISGALVVVGLALVAGGVSSRRPLRTASFVLGLAVVVYGVSTLAGRWLGEPPWWTTHTPPSPEAFEGTGLSSEALRHFSYYTAPQRGRVWISLGVAAVGFCLVAWGAGPRRRHAVPAS